MPITRILADHNVEGQLDVLASIWLSDEWTELWAALEARFFTFEVLGLRSNVPDSDLWLLCQEHEMLLITSNRNCHGEDSLAATMRRQSHDKSLPVLPIADADRVIYDRAYAERVAVKILEVMLDIDRFLGTRRLYIP